jgi:hypothetical protein
MIARTTDLEDTRPVHLSIGIMAWNEENSIGATLESLFQQSVFARLDARGLRCEILCLPNGCTDGTARVAACIFERAARTHPHRAAISARVIPIPEPGRNNTWNRFVHEFSAREARFLYLMDADILFRHPDTIYSLFATLERDGHACVASGRQCKSLLFKERKTLRDRISLATSEMTGTIRGGFSGQLYCMRAETARRLYLPRDLAANDDGFFKAVICTGFLSRQEQDTTRIAAAPDAVHVYEAYLSLGEVLNNQKRQMIGQTGVHVLLEYLKTLPAADRVDLAETLRRLDQSDPDWLKRRIAGHVARLSWFGQLFPGLLTFRFRRLWQMKGIKKLTHFPAAAAGFAVTLVTCWRAHRFLKMGLTQYWPKAGRKTAVRLESATLPKDGVAPV